MTFEAQKVKKINHLKDIKVRTDVPGYIYIHV